MLGKYRQDYPDVHISLQTGDAAIALAKLQNREVDIAIDALPANLPHHLDFINIIT